MIEAPASLSVVLPVFNDGPAALRCLNSLKAMDQPAADTPVEIIVVDNGSTDGTREQLAGVTGILLLDEKRRGSYAARNRGAGAARGAVLAFTDSDCEVGPGWARAIVDALADPDVHAVQGHTTGRAGRSVWSAYCGRQYAETLQAMTEGPRLDRADTRNLAVRREVFERLGGFRTEWLYAGDWEFGARMHHEGMAIASEPSMQVTHHDPESLRRLLGTRRAQASCMASMVDRIPWLAESGYLAPAKRWYHGARRVPLLRRAMGGLLNAGASAIAGWLLLAHAGQLDPVGYRLFKAAGALAGAAGLYRPAPLLSDSCRE